MALTFPRWMAAAVAGLLIIAAAFFSRAPNERRELTTREKLASSMHRTAMAVNQEATRLREMALRDSVRGAIARLAATDSSRTFVSPRFPLEMQRQQRALGTRLALVRAEPRVLPIDIALVLDTIRTLRGVELSRFRIGTTHVLPTAANERCTAIVRNQPQVPWYGASNPTYWTRYLTSAATAARVLGPCGFYEAFGAPGPGVYEWLGNGAWKFGSLAGMRNAPMIALWSEYDALYRWYPLWGPTAGWPLRGTISSLGYRCASGDAEACRRAVLDPNSDPQTLRRPRISVDGIVPRPDMLDGERFTTLGPGESQFLADMARTLGPDTFRSFWTSDKPAAEAFQAATGQDIGAWTVAWARGRYGLNRRGPGADAWTTTLTLLLTLAGLGAAIAASRHRQMA